MLRGNCSESGEMKSNDGAEEGMEPDDLLCSLNAHGLPIHFPLGIFLTRIDPDIIAMKDHLQ